ncbi:hypothetical protein BB561_007009, partial [Smittium simulii]
MKFGKYIESEAVPEWHAAYMDYKGLKSIIKKTDPENIDNLDLPQYINSPSKLGLVNDTDFQVAQSSKNDCSSFDVITHDNGHNKPNDAVSRNDLVVIPFNDQEKIKAKQRVSFSNYNYDQNHNIDISGKTNTFQKLDEPVTICEINSNSLVPFDKNNKISTTPLNQLKKKSNLANKAYNTNIITQIKKFSTYLYNNYTVGLNHSGLKHRYTNKSLPAHLNSDSYHDDRFEIIKRKASTRYSPENFEPSFADMEHFKRALESRHPTDQQFFAYCENQLNKVNEFFQ